MNLRKKPLNICCVQHPQTTVVVKPEDGLWDSLDLLECSMRLMRKLMIETWPLERGITDLTEKYTLVGTSLIATLAEGKKEGHCHNSSMQASHLRSRFNTLPAETTHLCWLLQLISARTQVGSRGTGRLSSVASWWTWPRRRHRKWLCWGQKWNGSECEPFLHWCKWNTEHHMDLLMLQFAPSCE